MGKLDGKVAIVTGGSRGIGRGICLEMAQEGATVIVHYGRRRDEAEHVVQAINDMDSGAQAIYAQADMADPKAVGEMVESVATTYGRIDALVNNAGICPFRDFFDIDAETWFRTLHTNLSGVFFASQAAARMMRQQKRGSIVHVSSVTSLFGGEQQVHYAASKGGMNSLTTSMSCALREDGVRVNAILCGGVPTDINKHQISTEMIEQDQHRLPPNRLGTAGDVGKLAVYLTSDESEWMTGSLIPLDGGAAAGR